MQRALWLAATAVPVALAAREFIADVVAVPAAGVLLVRRPAWRRAAGLPASPRPGEEVVFTAPDGSLGCGLIVTAGLNRALVELQPGHFVSVPLADVRGDVVAALS